MCQRLGKAKVTTCVPKQIIQYSSDKVLLNMASMFVHTEDVVALPRGISAQMKNSFGHRRQASLLVECGLLYSYIACDPIVPKPDWVRCCRQLQEILGLSHRRGKFPDDLKVAP